MFGRVRATKSAPEHDDGAATGSQHRAVRLGVDPPRAARDDGESCGGERSGKASGLLKSGGAASPRTDNRDANITQSLDIARNSKQRRRVGNLQERPRVPGIIERHETSTDAMKAIEFALRITPSDGRGDRAATPTCEIIVQSVQIPL